MDTRKVTEEYRLAQWMKVIQERQDSGQNVKDFCEKTGINRNSYYYWQRKLRKATCTGLIESTEPVAVIPSGWVELANNDKCVLLMLK